MENIIDNIITNSNGDKYKVLNMHGSYTLLETIDKKNKEFIVAYDLQKHEDVYNWRSGHYYKDITIAQECFDEKTKK